MPSRKRAFTRLVISESDACIVYISDPHRLLVSGAFHRFFDDWPKIELPWLGPGVALSRTEDRGVYTLDLPGHLDGLPDDLEAVGVKPLETTHLTVTRRYRRPVDSLVGEAVY